MAVTLTRGKAENSIDTDDDEDEEEDENAQENHITKELERGNFRLTAHVVFRVRLRAVVFPDQSFIVFGVLLTAKHAEKHG